jgi:hypothetical protein
MKNLHYRLQSKIYRPISRKECKAYRKGPEEMFIINCSLLIEKKAKDAQIIFHSPLNEAVKEL